MTRLCTNPRLPFLTLPYLTESKHTAAGFLLQTLYVTSRASNTGIPVYRILGYHHKSEQY